jgi:hypothetical protein
MFELELSFIVYMRAIWKVTSSELLKNQAMRKKICYIKKDKYILKQLLNVVTARNEAPVVSGNKFLYACIKKVCLH